MRQVPVWTLLPLILLAACQSTGPSQSGGQGAKSPQGRPCTSRMQDAGQCGTAGIYSFPELANVR
jgi:hypothetical protein